MNSLGSALINVLDTTEAWFKARSRQWDRCESPIEQRMCCALGAIGCRAGQGSYHPDRRAEMARLINQPAAFVFAQQPIGPYRVDFLIVIIDPTLRRSHSLVIECDGEDYHDAERDRERDSRLVLDHHVQSVQRFSGSQINHDLENTMRHISDILIAQGVDPIPVRFLKSDVEDTRQRRNQQHETLKAEAEEARVERYRRSLETGIWDDDDA